MNLAHGGKKTQLSKLILNNKNVIAKTIHYEEGARFWRKPNQNWLLYLDKKQQKKIKPKKGNFKPICKNNFIYDLIN